MESAYSLILCLLLGRELAAWAKRGCAAISRHLPPGLLLHVSEAEGWLSSYGRLEEATSPRYGFVASGPVRGKGSILFPGAPPPQLTLPQAIYDISKAGRRPQSRGLAETQHLHLAPMQAAGWRQGLAGKEGPSH